MTYWLITALGSVGDATAGGALVVHHLNAKIYWAHTYIYIL